MAFQVYFDDGPMKGMGRMIASPYVPEEMHFLHNDEIKAGDGWIMIGTEKSPPPPMDGLVKYELKSSTVKPLKKYGEHQGEAHYEEEAT